MDVNYKIAYWIMLIFNIITLIIILAFYNNYGNLTSNINERLAPYEADHSQLMEKHNAIMDYNLAEFKKQGRHNKILLNKFIESELKCND
jgi:hypothetical protein